MKGLQESLQRVATHNMVKKVLSTVAQWERHAVRFCAWRMAGISGAKGETDLGLGWWELPEHENYQVGVADATAAMIHAIQFGGAMEFGGSIRDLTIFVREYVQGCRLTCAIKRYTSEEKKEKNHCNQHLRTAFEEAEESRANFEEQARVITSKLPKKHAEGKTLDALHILALQRAKNFDTHLENCKQISDGWLSLQNVHAYQALARLYPRLAAIEKEMEDTIRSMTELTNPGGSEAPEVDVLEEEEPQPDEHPKKRAQRRRETMRKRRLAMEKKMSNNADSQQMAAARSQIPFEDKEAHDTQLAELNKRFKQISDDVELNLDASDRQRLQHLFALLLQGQQKMQEVVDGLVKAEADATKFALTVSEKLRIKYEKWAMESLKRGRVPTDMDAGALRRGSGPTPQDRDDLRRRNANLRMDIEERMMETEEERELKEELEEVLEKLQEITHGALDTSSSDPTAPTSVVGEDDLGLPTLEPVRQALDLSVRHAAAAQAMAFSEFVQLTTSCVKIERTARNLGQTLSKLADGQVIGKPDAQEADWTASCKDLILDMEQVLDIIKVNGLPKSIVDKFWQEKQMEIKAAQMSVEDANDKRSKKAQRDAKKMEIKLEAAIQEQENKKKPLLLAIEALWMRAQLSQEKPPEAATPRGRATVALAGGAGGAAAPTGGVVPVPAGATVAAPAARQTVVGSRASQLGPGGAVMERILQSHRADIANGHQRRKVILEDIRKLEEQIKESEPAMKPPAPVPERDADPPGAAVQSGGTVEDQGGEIHDTGAELETVDWLGLNQRLGKDKTETSDAAQVSHAPAGPAPGQNSGEKEGESAEESSSSSSSEEEDRPKLEMDPWILAFPFDLPDLAKQKFQFCQQHRIKTHRLHEPGKQKKYQFLLRRLIKQEKRTLMLKQKLLLKFLSGDELQRAKNEMKKGPADFKAEAEIERGKLRDRQAMIAKLLNFWRRRMKLLEDDQEAQHEAFRLKVKALLEDIHSLASVAESAALAKKRRRRVEADDLLRLRQKKAEEAARIQVEEERESMITSQALKAATDTEGQGSMTALQKMAAFARGASIGEMLSEGDDATERLRLSKILRTFMLQKSSAPASGRDAAPGAAGNGPGPGATAPGLPTTPGRQLRRPSIGRRLTRRSTEMQEENDLQISATRFHRPEGAPDAGEEIQEVPTQTLNLEGDDNENEGKVLGSSSLRKVLSSSTSGRRGTRVNAKRKPSVAQRDSIFANPAAMSRRITGDATARANTVEVTLAGGVGNPDGDARKAAVAAAAKSAAAAPKSESGLAKADSQEAGTESLPTSVPLVAETWTLGDVPNRPVTSFGGLKGSQAVKGKTGRLTALPLTPRSSSPDGVRRQSTVRKSISSRQSREHTPRNSQSQVQIPLQLSVGAEHRNSFMQGLRVKAPEVRPLSRPGSRAGSEEGGSGPPSRRASEREIDHEEVRAEMFLKATYMHLSGARAHVTHPALKNQKAALSDALFCVQGERLFRGLVAQIMDLAPEMALKVVRNIINTERGRCLFIIKNSLIHQARLELEASQRVIHILEQDVDEVQRQLAQGGPLFPLSGKPRSETSSSSSASEGDEEDRPASPTSSPKRGSKEEKDGSPLSPHRVRSRRAGMRGFMAFADSMARSAARRPTVQVVLGEGEVEAPLLQIRSAETQLLPVSKHEVPSSAKRGSKSMGKPFLAPTNMTERLREAQLTADAQGPRTSQSSEKPERGVSNTVFASSLATSMLKTMLKRPTVAPAEKSSMSNLFGDSAWDKVVRKLESNLNKHNFDPELTAGQWKSHFAWDLLNDDPLSSRLPQDRPRSAPPGHVKHLPKHQRRTVWCRASVRPVAPEKAAAGNASEQAEANGDQDEQKPTSAPMLFALAKFMSRMKNKKPSHLDNFFYVQAVKEKWQQRPSRLKLLTEEMEEEYQEVRQKLIKEKGLWLQKSRRKVEQMELHLEEELDQAGGYDRQKRNLRERGAFVSPQEQRGFDAISFVRWKVDKQLKQAMQEAERGSRVGPVTRERTAGPPPHEPVWIAGDKRYNSNLEASKQRIATLRAKKARDPRLIKHGRGRSWRMALDVFEDLDDRLANPDAYEDSESETDSQSPNSRSQSITRFTPARRSRARRRSSGSKGRELSVLSPWMRSEFMSDEEYDLRPDTWDLRCWLQPVQHRARTATDRVFTPEHRGKALSRKGSRSDPGQKGRPQDPVLLVKQACRQLVEEFAEVPQVPAVQILDADAGSPAVTTESRAAVMDDFEAKHSKVLEILQQDSLLNQEPLDSVLEEDEEDSGSATERSAVGDAGDLPKASRKDPRKRKDGSASRKSRKASAAAERPAPPKAVRSLPMLTTQTLMFEPEVKSGRQKVAITARGPGPTMSASSSAPSLHSNSSQGSLHGQPRRGPALAPHAVRVAAARREAPGAPLKPRRRSSRFQMFHVVARPLQDLQKLQTLERRLRSVSPEASSTTGTASRRGTEVVEASSSGPSTATRTGNVPRMTVNIGKLSKELAKRWTNVTSQEVEHRRVEMEKLKEEDDIQLDSFYEYHQSMKRQNTDQGAHGAQGVARGEAPGDTRMSSRRLMSKGSMVEASAPSSAAAAGAAAAQAAAAAQLKVQKHLAQLRSWRNQGKPPSSPVPLPVLVPKEEAPVRKEKSQPAGRVGGTPELPVAVAKSDQYLKGFKDADLSSLLEEITQTDTFPEGDHFVWAPRKAGPRPQLSRGESWIKAIVRGDSPYMEASTVGSAPWRRDCTPEVEH